MCPKIDQQISGQINQGMKRKLGEYKEPPIRYGLKTKIPALEPEITSGLTGSQPEKFTQHMDKTTYHQNHSISLLIGIDYL